MEISFHTFDLIKYGGYAAALLTIGMLCTAAYESNAWASDLHRVEISQQRTILEMEKRALTRGITQWGTKPASTQVEKQYKKVILDQLRSDKEDISIKLRGLQID